MTLHSLKASAGPAGKVGKGFWAKSTGKRAELWIYDEVGPDWFGYVSAKAVADELKKAGKLDSILLHINSPGGSVFEGVAIYNTLKKNGARVEVEIDGLAASIASIVAMAGDEIRMASNALMMIHDPWTFASGTSADLRETADMMDKVRDTLLDTYMHKATISRDDVSALMSAETWLSAAEAKEKGFADTITDELKIAAKYDLSRFRNAPAAGVSPVAMSKPEAGREKVARMFVRSRRAASGGTR